MFKFGMTKPGATELPLGVLLVRTQSRSSAAVTCAVTCAIVHRYPGLFHVSSKQITGTRKRKCEISSLLVVIMRSWYQTVEDNESKNEPHTGVKSLIAQVDIDNS